MKKLYLILPFAFLLSCSNNQELSTENLTKEKDIIDSNEVYEEEMQEELIVEEPAPTISLENPLRAYISDQFGGATNIRSMPAGDIIEELPNSNDYIIYIVAKSGRWFKVEKIDAIEETINLPNNEGWIHGSVIGFGTRNYGGQELHLYSSPDDQSDVVATINQESGVKLVDIDDEWVKVEWRDANSNIFIGWIEREWLCGNPLTNCC